VEELSGGMEGGEGMASHLYPQGWILQLHRVLTGVDPCLQLCQCLIVELVADPIHLGLHRPDLIADPVQLLEHHREASHRHAEVGGGQ
ncbi:MAG: hypothetical protein ACK56I_28915, partial [bacterium]